MVEGVAQRGLDDAGGFLGREPVLGLPLELRLADEHREQRAGRGQNVLRRQLRGPLVADELAIGAQALDESRAQAGLMGAAVRRWHGVAIGVEEAVLAGDPGDGPFHRAMAFALVAFAGEEFLGDGLLAFDAAGEKVLEPTWKVEHGAWRRFLVAGEQRRGAGPADLDTAEEIGL